MSMVQNYPLEQVGSQSQHLQSNDELDIHTAIAIQRLEHALNEISQKNHQLNNKVIQISEELTQEKELSSTLQKNLEKVSETIREIQIQS